MADNKTLKINIDEIIKDPEIFDFVPDHLKTKNMCKHAVKKLLFSIKYVPDRYKTQRMCEMCEVILKNAGMLMFVPDSCVAENMCNKAGDNYPNVLGSVPIAIRPKNRVIKLSGLILL